MWREVLTSSGCSDALISAAAARMESKDVKSICTLWTVSPGLQNSGVYLIASSMEAWRLVGAAHNT